MGKVLNINKAKWIQRCRGKPNLQIEFTSVIIAFAGLRILLPLASMDLKTPPHHHQCCTYCAYTWQQQSSHLLEREQHIRSVGSGHSEPPLCSCCFSSALLASLKGASTTWKSHFCLFSRNLKGITFIVVKLKKLRIKIYLLVVFSQCLTVSMRGTTPSQGCCSNKGHKVPRGCYREKIWLRKPHFCSCCPLLCRSGHWLLPCTSSKVCQAALSWLSLPGPGLASPCSHLLAWKTLMQPLVFWKSANFKSWQVPFGLLIFVTALKAWGHWDYF